MFAIDDLVVYPAQGVGRVERIESHDIGGAKAEFYIVRILINSVTVMVPVKNALNVGLRKLSTPERGQDIFAFLRDRSDFTGYTGQNWNRRYREYSEKLKSGDLKDVAYVLKELMLISKEKELSFGERRLLEHATSLLTLELAYAMSKTQDEIRDLIHDLFADVYEAQEAKQK